MSAFYDLASLVLVPSGYKASKVYAQKPLTTDGQLTFSRASTATRVNSAGLIETVSSNVPRLDYLGSTCPKLQLEPQRTNMARNWNLTAATWGKDFVTATAASGIAPTGNNEAYKITPNSSGTERFFYDDNGSASYTANTDYTNTIFAKAAGINWCYARFEIKGNTSSYVYFNLATGAVGSTTGSVSVVKSIENYGNGWYRIRVTGNMGTGIGGSNNVLFGICDADGSTYVTASGSNGVLFFGPQSEQGSYHTSAIQTSGAAVTRLADACSKTGISSLIGQTEGVFFLDFIASAQVADTGGNFSVLFTAGESGTNFQIYTAGTNLRFYKEPSVIDFTSSINLVAGQRYKLAYAYKAGQYAFYANGVQLGTSTNATVPAVSSLYLNYFNGGTTYQAKNEYSQMLFFKTRLTNAQLAELTTL